MNERQIATANDCRLGAQRNTMNFPQIVGALTQAGFESYHVDFRSHTTTYFLPDGESLTLAAPDAPRLEIAARFDPAALRAAIAEAQAQAPGYTYAGFCRRAAAAGCAGYIVSFSGARALYFGRTAETHVEHFPQRPE